MPNAGVGLIGGVDSHRDTIHVAVISPVGQAVADREFDTTTAGYQACLVWLDSHGRVDRVGVEGSSSYGLGIATALTTTGMTVVEVNLPRPAERRKQGKSDQLDACYPQRISTNSPRTGVKRQNNVLVWVTRAT